jgi:phospholipase C
VREHRGEPQQHPPGTANPDPVVRDHRKSKIKHVFVLMLENRSFDHMLGFSGLTGTDAATGQPTFIDGLNGFRHADAFCKQGRQFMFFFEGNSKCPR